MNLKAKVSESGISFMIPFTITLIFLIGSVFIFLFLRDRANEDQFLEVRAREIAQGVLAVRNVFAENQDKINSDSQGRYEYKDLNPASAANEYTRAVNKFDSIIVKQTSSLSRIKENAPDAWETNAIRQFEENPHLEKVSENIKESNQFRFAIPLYIEPECLQCHGDPKGEYDITGYQKEGYKVGDLRGIISVSIPLGSYYVTRTEQIILFLGLTIAIISLTWIAGQRMVKTLQEVANTDRLTKIFNRNVFYTRLEKEIEFSRQRRVPFSLLIFDIDHFKKVNDNHGHLAGDEILRKLANTVKGIIREGDTLARFGGEEFIIIAPNTDEDGAIALGEKIRVAVEKESFIYDVNSIPITISVGVVTAREKAVQKELIDQADKALYQAKSKGRNRVEEWKGSGNAGF